MKKNALLLLAITVLSYCLPQYTLAQVTTATITGKVTNAQKKPISGASVTIKYAAAGISQNAVTLSDGRFTVPNLRVGGPYIIEVSYVGYHTQKQDDVLLDLGLNNSLEFVLVESNSTLQNVVVTSTNKIDDKKTGAATNVSGKLLKALPTISRSMDDYLRLAPSASATYNGMSFGGRNGQYNNFSLDGAVFNNPFGLDAPTPGGQTGAQPISLDAIDQIQINIAPYDVTQAGFTGAGVNTVTKSGTNKTTGTVYGFFRNKAMTGKKVDGTKLAISDLGQVQAGFTLGGALKKNKLFYFLSVETEQRHDAASSYNAQNASNVGQASTSRVLESDLIAVSNILKSKFGYETGAYQGFTHKQNNYKWLAKLDWNINNNNKLSFTYNGLDAIKDKPAHPSAIGRRGPDYTTLQFRNSGYQMVNKLHSFSTELKSNFKNNTANKLRAVYTSFRDKRNPFSAPFPTVNISKFGSRYIVAGHEPFSVNNNLKQDALQLTNDFNIYKKNHTFTIGASYESFKFANSFNLVAYGPTLFGDIDIQNFKDSVPVSGASVFGAYPLDVDVNIARNRFAANKWQLVEFTVAQASFYLQDEFQATPNFKLTYGVRIDKPLYNKTKFTDPKINGNGTYAGTDVVGNPTIPNNDNLVLFDANGNPIQNGVGKALDNTKMPTGKPLFSPRIGFSWNVKSDKTVQLRGGTGLFTGRFPFVWVGNHIGNPYSGFYNVTAPDFKWPQVWRTNIGADFKIPAGTVFTTDVSYTKDINAMMVRNYKLGIPTGTLASGTGDNRKIYTAANQGANNTYVFTNTKTGYQFNASIQATQSFKKGLFIMAGYNYLIAKDASSISAEISSDAFDRNPILNNANEAKLTPSLYGNTHRFLIAATKKIEYKKMATTFSVFANWTSGNRYGYVYGGDINNDGTGTNDIMYVPTDAEINTMAFAPLLDVNGVLQNAAAQRTALQRFINQDKYLNGLKGQYTEKYGAKTPGFSQIDVRVLQDFKVKVGSKENKIQVSLDVQNIGNMLSSKWGVRKYATSTGYFQPLSVGLTGSTPTYQFDPAQTKTFVSSPDLQSRWQIQFGVRYIF
ncbi:MAG: carboxypeptidase regulatory-like domain-containing protein [Ferruginibacter sp.]|nr:TonB-dependent receptor [Ferruginibacter sp.]